MSFPYTLVASYTPANTSGTITFPDHLNNIGDINPDAFSSSTDAIYINVVDANNVDRTTYLSALTAVGATLTLTQSGHSAIYQTTSDSFRLGLYPGGGGGIQAYYDPIYEDSTPMIRLQAAGVNFTAGDQVYVTVNGTPPSNEGLRVHITGKASIQGKFKA